MSDEEQLGGVTAVLGVCALERQRVADALPTDLRLATTAETELGLLDALLRAIDAPSCPARVVLECSSAVLPHDVVALFDSGLLSERAVLAAVVTVVDAEHLLADLTGDRSVDRLWSGDEAHQPLASVAMDQIEHSDAVVVASWRRMRREPIGRILVLLAHLNPAARLSMFRGGRTWVRRMTEVRRRHG